MRIKKVSDMDKRTIPAHRSMASILRSAQSGQAIVLIALVMIVLIGMLGLAIDGGGLYFLWRDAQNADDAAVLAASYARCTNGDFTHAALEAAAQNGFDNNGQSNTVKVYSPPITGSAVGKANYVQVDITAVKPSYFIHLVYKGPLQVTTRAVGYCNPPLDPSTVPAVFAGSLTCQNAIHWTNSGNYVEGGLFSNNDILMQGGGQGNVIVGDSGAVNIVDYHSQNTTWYESDGTTTTTPTNHSDQRTDPLSLQVADYMPANIHPTPPLYTAIFSSSDDNAFHDPSPGSGKLGVWNPPNGTQLEGFYYVNGDVTIGTGVIVDGDRNGDGKHEGLTIVAQGSIDIQVGSGKQLNYYKNAGIGLIAFSGAGTGEPCGYNAVKVSGSAASVWGVVYAPYGGVDFNLSNLTIHGTIIGNTVTMGGSQFTLIYDPTLLPARPPSIQVAE